MQMFISKDNLNLYNKEQYELVLNLDSVFW